MILASSPSILWFLTRGTGAAALVVLTVGLLFGIATSAGLKTESWPRFVTQGLHRNLTLLVLVFLGAHIVTAVADSFAPVGVLDALVPFASSYRPLWLGFGTLAFDLLIAVFVTTAIAPRLGYRNWRLVHLLSYAVWPLALVHGLGTGSDVRGSWLTWLSIACGVSVVAAIIGRLALRWWEATPARAVAAGATVLAGLVIVLWARSGPLEHGWAAKAGTPASLLVAPVAHSGSTVSHTAGAAVVPTPFTARLHGRIREFVSSSGEATVTIDGTVGSDGDVLHIVLRGHPIAGGGILLRRSSVTFGPPSSPTAYTGRVVGLDGARIAIALASGSSTISLDVRIVNRPGGIVGGTVHAVAAASDRAALGAGENE